MDFASRTVKMPQSYKEIRLVFDRYITGSLKSQTKNYHTSGIKIRYQIADNTNIVNISLKQQFHI